MKAFVMKKIGETGWVEKPVPKCSPMGALLKPIALAPCTSDVHTVWEGAVGERTDLTLGHEGVGEIIEVGPLVKDFKPGDKVIVPAITPDWNSLEAQAGFSMHSGGMLGGWKFSNIADGLFSEVFHVNDADGNLALLPEGVDPAAATMLSDMVPTGFHASELADVKYGDTVCVIGIGPVGLMAVAGAVLRGASHVFAVGTRPNCVQVAKEYGATDIISYKEGSIDSQVLKKTGGKGVDKVLIAGGNCDTFAEAVRMLKPGGAIGNVNYLGEGEYIKIPRAAWGVGMGHKKIVGGLMPGGRLRMEKLVSLLVTGRLDTSKLITHRLQGLESIEAALMLMKDKPRDLIKPIVLL
ncbi:NAD(P)-dependent alcohol dehydrogenase [Desulforamulus aeronauticus]|uniref:Threonine dehydrogenase n=1 Tax=Desulforamulus aeronauticus DSM 10349 TaxID=1121421 RepID=A0A1M6WZ69_9FIRM|nr:NAD(P)-dependent alcohol dehydrogenase [Desulforamulus aeronauticus]SHK98964.1 Threonine dehydrogenase [Desulforamulus aeronauticus DSM 10349]